MSSAVAGYCSPGSFRRLEKFPSKSAVIEISDTPDGKGCPGRAHIEYYRPRIYVHAEQATSVMVLLEAREGESFEEIVFQRVVLLSRELLVKQGLLPIFPCLTPLFRATGLW